MLKYLCEDGFANVFVAKILALPTMGTDCMCCLGTRIWAALLVGVAIGVLV
jgi:hypothetical protein